MNGQVHARLGPPCASGAEQCVSELDAPCLVQRPQRLTTVIRLYAKQEDEVLP